MAGQRILVAYNFTPYDQKSLDFVVRTFGSAADAEVTLFNAYPPVPEIDRGESEVMRRMGANLTYLHQRLDEQRAALEEARRELVDRGFDGTRVRCVFRPGRKDAASEIIDAASEERFDVIVMNYKPGRVTRFFKGDVYTKVVCSLRDVAVCIVS